MRRGVDRIVVLKFIFDALPPSNPSHQAAHISDVLAWCFILTSHLRCAIAIGDLCHINLSRCSGGRKYTVARQRCFQSQNASRRLASVTNPTCSRGEKVARGQAHVEDVRQWLILSPFQGFARLAPSLRGLRYAHPRLCSARASPFAPAKLHLRRFLQHT